MGVLHEISHGSERVNRSLFKGGGGKGQQLDACLKRARARARARATISLFQECS